MQGRQNRYSPAYRMYRINSNANTEAVDKKGRKPIINLSDHSLEHAHMLKCIAHQYPVYVRGLQAMTFCPMYSQTMKKSMHT